MIECGGKMISVRFLAPHRVISTCRVHGGLRDELDGVFNHQSCEPAAHMQKNLNSIVAEPERYHQRPCEQHGVAELSASLGTAANMNHAAIATRSFRDLSVTAICTGGVEDNAGRASDPASVWKSEEELEPLDKTGAEPPGTINMILLINRELSHGAMVRSIVTATEAKSAVLQELASTSSRYSEGLATGTGTDQIAVCCALGRSRPLTSAGKHSKLGELICCCPDGSVHRRSPERDDFLLIDLDHLRIALLSNEECHHPEAVTALAKEGCGLAVGPGFELYPTGNYDCSVIPPKIVGGVHLRFFVMLRQIWRNDREGLLRMFGSEETMRHYYGGVNRQAVISCYRSQLELAARFNVPYVVFHPVHYELEYVFNWQAPWGWRETIDLSAEIINEVVRDTSYDGWILFKNLWWPGNFQLDSTDEIDRLLSKVRWPKYRGKEGAR